MNYYNEFDKFAADWLRELIEAGQIPFGIVDDRSIEDVTPGDLEGFTQCHFFAGIGGWSRALELAGWPDDRPCWTGSAPCQSFSAAGKGKGFADERHLWPAWLHLISQCRPPVIIGEQVAAAIGHGWLDLVQSDLEGEGYAVGHGVLGAHSVGAPHQRQRLVFVADADSQRRSGQRLLLRPEAAGRDSGEILEAAGGGGAGIVADASGERREVALFQPGSGDAQSGLWEANVGGGGGAAGWLGDSNESRLEGRQPAAECTGEQPAGPPSLAGFWSGSEWIPCRDGKWRPVEPGIFPLAHGLQRGVVPSGDPSSPEYANATAEARQARLKGYGNAIVPQMCGAFVAAYMEVTDE